MGNRIVLQKPEAKRGRVAYIAGAVILGLAIVVVWGFQLYTMMNETVAQGVPNEFSTSISQIEESVKQAEASKEILGNPLEEQGQLILKGALQDLNESKKESFNPLPISPSRVTETETYAEEE